jgi:hypothetical protein
LQVFLNFRDRKTERLRRLKKSGDKLVELEFAVERRRFRFADEKTASLFEFD